MINPGPLDDHIGQLSECRSLSEGHLRSRSCIIPGHDKIGDLRGTESEEEEHEGSDELPYRGHHLVPQPVRHVLDDPQPPMFGDLVSIFKIDLLRLRNEGNDDVFGGLVDVHGGGECVGSLVDGSKMLDALAFLGSHSQVSGGDDG